MTENERDLVVYESHKPLLAKWLKILLYAHLASVVCSLLGLIPVVSVVAGWGSTAVSVACIYALFQLSPACTRYQKAAIFSAVALVCGLVAQSILSLVISICSIVAMYQEYMGHSEVTSQTDPALSGKWNSLFTIQLVVGILSGVASSAGVVIGVLAQMSTDALVGIIVFIMAVIGIGLELLYLNYLNQMLKHYSE